MKNDKKNHISEAREVFFWAQALAIALVVLVCINTFLFRLTNVRGTSMYDTLDNGDQLILRIIGYDRPEYGDIVVCTSDGFDGEALVKRVIAVAGDTVDIGEDGQVIVNGIRLVEPYIYETIHSDKHGDQIYPLKVLDGHVFVMGDNRNGSTDSRWTYVDQIDCERIVGKVLLRLWPLNRIGSVH